jgi:hypothetical protein
MARYTHYTTLPHIGRMPGKDEDAMELTITTDRSRGWSRTLYVVDEETFARIFQNLKENNVTIPAGCTCNTETLIYEHHLYATLSASIATRAHRASRQTDPVRVHEGTAPDARDKSRFPAERLLSFQWGSYSTTAQNVTVTVVGFDAHVPVVSLPSM